MAGEVLPGAAALARAGLEPVTLAAKEGLALTNGTSVMNALGVLEAWRADRLSRTADIAGCLSLEALHGTELAFDARIHALRPFPRQVACADYLRRQMELMRPKIIVCLGRISAAEIIKPDFKITQEHGQFFEKNGMLMMALYHPAALLRDPHKKPDTFVDLKRLQDKIREICDHTLLTFS